MSVETNGHRTLNAGNLDRKLALGLGGLLALSTLAPLPGRLLRLGIGSVLLYRGIAQGGSLTDALGLGAPRRDEPKLQLLEPGRGIRMERSVTVNRPRAEVFGYWRDLSHLPRFMRHVKSVTSTGGDRSHWVAAAPFEVRWDAQITEERPDELIAWRSLEGSQVNNAGQVRFVDAPGGRGTEVHVIIEYSPGGGPAGEAAAKLVQGVTATQIREDLNRFKAILETGEVASVEGQSSGREAIQGPQEAGAGDDMSKDPVIQASEDSFPASDPPGWISSKVSEEGR
jgi:uncharacterized membrane protein